MDISIHALVKRATLSVKASSQISNYFNPRPREEGDIASDATSATEINFNPRPREEGDDTAFKSSLFDNISIHALVKRATAARLQKLAQ